MKLYLLRHGEAEPKQSGQSDSERSLTENGKRQVLETSKRLKAEGKTIDLILSSPFLRAYQTAEIAANELGLKDKFFKEPLLTSGCRTPQIKQILNAHKDCKAILCAGHEPDFGIIAGELLGLGEARPLKKAEIVEIDI